MGSMGLKLVVLAAAGFLAFGMTGEQGIVSQEGSLARAVAPKEGVNMQASGETLYNGIVLPAVWPPRDRIFSDEPPPTPSYLVSPPKVIPIDVGRQLFVDDFLIEKTTLTRVFHAAKYHQDNPVVKPDKTWEMEGQYPAAMVNSDGVWYDPADKLFKMWYMGGGRRSTCYATSKDGIHWKKPSLDVVPGTNMVFDNRKIGRGSSSICLDLEEKDKNRRFKLIWGAKAPGENGRFRVHFSSDGIHWGDAVAHLGPCGDTTTFFWNPFRKVWVFSIKDPHLPGREEIYIIPQTNEPQKVKRRWYYECRDLVNESKWRPDQMLKWIGADKLDPPRPDFDIKRMLYRLDCIAYESLILGLFDIWHGEPPDRIKPNDVVAGFSRDGFNWWRPNREPLFGVSERYGDWNWGDVQPAGGCCLIVGDELYFYVQGRAGNKGTKDSGVNSTGLAILRRDGFASMDAGATEGMLMTRPVRFKGKYMFVNVDCPDGELTMEVLDETGSVIQPFSRENCIPIGVDKTLQAVSWKGADNLAALSDKSVRFMIYLKKGKLYSLWVSPETSGASHGYVAAGGPGFTGSTDTVGSTL